MSNWKHLKRINISEYPIRAFLPTAIFTSLLILIYNEEIEWKTLQIPGFYIAWMVSLLVASLLIAIVFVITLWLDYIHPWYRNYNRRLLYQSIWGLLVPTILSFLIISIYFYWYSIDIFKTIWFQFYLPQIVLLLIVFNSVLLYYWHKNWNGRVYKLKRAKSQNNSNSLDPQLIACVFSHNKVCYALDFNGIYQIIDLTLEESMDQLPIANYFQINRSFIFSFYAIEQLEIKNFKNYFLYLKEPIDMSIRHILNSESNRAKEKQSVKIFTNGDTKIAKYKIAQGQSHSFEQIYNEFLNR